MREMTNRNLRDAFAGESQAHLRYQVFADLAERERLANVTRLFRAAAFAERMHATNHLRALGGAGKTLQNLEIALAGETFEVNEMYPAYIEVATMQEEKRAAGSMGDAFQAEKIHAQLYTKAKEAVAAGGDVELGKVWVCDVCGYTLEGEAPDRCPVCNSVRSHFQEF
jgi:rubrerythrin